MPPSTVQAHFQLFATNTSSPIKWRLLSGNNRELGRCVATYADVESCLVATKVFVESVDELTGQVRRREEGGWAWSLTSGLEPIVVCGRSYDRQVRCEQALANFRHLAAVAVSGTGVVITASRRWSHSSQGTRPMALNSGVERPRRPHPAPGALHV
jgi:hypothetical protein